MACYTCSIRICVVIAFRGSGLQRQALPYQHYLELMMQEASRERRLLAGQRRRAYQKGQDSP